MERTFGFIIPFHIRGYALFVSVLLTRPLASSIASSATHNICATQHDFFVWCDADSLLLFLRWVAKMIMWIGIFAGFSQGYETHWVFLIVLINFMLHLASIFGDFPRHTSRPRPPLLDACSAWNKNYLIWPHFHTTKSRFIWIPARAFCLHIL